MKITQRIKSYAALALGLCLLGAGMTGCIKDEYGAEQKETTLTLTVSTRSDDPTQTNNDGKTLEPNEEMKTLRVIVARHDPQEIIYNWFEEDIAADDFKRTINFSELTISTTGEQFDFYAIANERSLDLPTSIPTLEGKNVNLTALKDCITNRDYNVWTDENIPQTAFEPVSVVPETTDDFTMQLKFVVAKVRVNFVNETGESQTIENIRMEGVKPNQGYLFNDEAEGVYVPASTQYETLTISQQGIEVPAGADNNTASVSAYLYPSDPEKQFVLKASWNNRDYALEEGTGGNITSGNLVSALDRNQLLDITVTLKKSAVEVELVINYEVKEWTPTDIEVPPFN